MTNSKILIPLMNKPKENYGNKVSGPAIEDCQINYYPFIQLILCSYSQCIHNIQRQKRLIIYCKMKREVKTWYILLGH